MFCTKCGKEILEKDFFCSNCGKKILTVQSDVAVNPNSVSNTKNNSKANALDCEIGEEQNSKAKVNSNKSDIALSDITTEKVDKPIDYEQDECVMRRKSGWWLGVNFLNACTLHFFINTFASERGVILGGLPAILIILFGYAISAVLTDAIHKKIEDKITLFFIGFFMPIIFFFAVASLLAFLAKR